MWVLDYEEDIASDLSAFHRVDEPMTLDGPRYFSLAVRLAAYAGVLAARAEEQRQAERDGHSGPQTPRAAAESRSSVSDTVALAMLEADGYVERVTEGESA